MKNLKTLIIVIAVAGLAYLAYNLNKGKDNSKLAEEALSDFAIKDTASINKLILTDTEGSKGINLVRTPKGWTTDKGGCVQQHLVHTILQTIKHISVKSLVPSGSIETVNKSLTGHHRKMEIYQNGVLTKTWYIGNPTPDHYGTYMLLKDPEKGKSPEPFIMHMPNENGSLQTRFITNPLEFQCTGVFNYEPLDIKSIDVKIPETPELNFKIVALSENSFALFNNATPVNDFDTTMVRGYILYYKKIHFESHNSLLDKKGVDSLKASTPYYSIEVTTKSGEVNKIKAWKKRFIVQRYDLEGKLLEFDQDRLWILLNDGTLVVGQYHVFDKLFRDINFFKGQEQDFQENLQ